MESFCCVNGKRYKVTDGNTIVRLEGERLVEEELNGGGYTAMLNAFIKRRDAELEKENEQRKNKLKKPLDKEAEPNI